MIFIRLAIKAHKKELVQIMVEIALSWRIMLLQGGIDRLNFF